ncbi:glycosyltransferase [Pseudodesulfovibrio sp. F-1]|uniref:Glycosyltransferase n=1 Tax=Pseudodesulfovibrio alkaliphilus TaxID=2661613 RepID=A0A7K1KMZ8_9BACT|nr:glycosyltransferase family 4 protein [Pseudodesulfovibrio alkaliphilus]MUM77407.1 glycosyltransferase [Pseudodesulfovibrio alkaliphilus]
MVNNIAALSGLGVRTYTVLSPDSAIIPALSGLDVEIIPFGRFRDYLHAGAFLKRLVADKNIDVVHTFHNRAYKMGVLARLMGARCRLYINRGVISRPNAVFFLWTALADGVIANSMHCAGILRAHGVMQRRLNVVYNAYTGPDIPADPSSEDEKGGTVRFVYAGNVARIKGFDVFLRAASALCQGGEGDRFEFVGVGVGPLELERFPEQVSPAVRERLRLTGTIPHQQVLAELCQGDVLVLTSRMESLPNALIEGFGQGLPAICTSVGGIPEVVRDGFNGCLCPSEDADCLADKMRLLAADPSLRTAMGKAGRAVVRTLMTLEAKGAALMRVYAGERVYGPLTLDEVPLNKS